MDIRLLKLLYVHNVRYVTYICYTVCYKNMVLADSRIYTMDTSWCVNMHRDMG
jgi:hypothetical protein